MAVNSSLCFVRLQIDAKYRLLPVLRFFNLKLEVLVFHLPPNPQSLHLRTHLQENVFLIHVQTIGFPISVKKGNGFLIIVNLKKRVGFDVSTVFSNFDAVKFVTPNFFTNFSCFQPCKIVRF